MVMPDKSVIETLRARRAIVFLLKDDATRGVGMWEYDDGNIFLISICHNTVEWEHAVQLKEGGWNYAVSYYDAHDDYRLSEFTAQGWCNCPDNLFTYGDVYDHA